MPVGKKRSTKKKTSKHLKPDEVKDVKKIVRSTIRGDLERKYWILPTTSQSASVSTTAQIIDLYSLQNITQGTSDFVQRVGDTIKVSSIHFKFNLIAGDPNNLIRIMLIKKKDATATVPTASQILSGSYTNGPLAYRTKDLNNANGYTVIKDRVIGLNGNSNDNIVLAFDHLFKGGLKQQFQAGSSSNCTNRLFLLFVSDSAAVPHVSINYTSRMYYTDA